ncbi:MAG: SOS cell division inhibitor [Betaproteobacteria bacterium HGW-Betaproteobacteria-10]|nr:MAG: SOS cell division inhibitor [Betaproteobacteria bacterium HGW-Betaproteobacteria-10]
MSTVPRPVVLAEALARGDIWRGDMLASLPESTLPTGHSELDEALPGGGWPQGNLTEILVDRSGLGEMTLLLPALARLSAEGGWLALVAPPWLPHAPAWAAAGLFLERLVIVKAGKQAAWCCEQLLACGGFAGVLAWPDAGIDAKALRRLQAAVDGQPTYAWLWRPVSLAATPSPAPLRIVLAASEGGVSVRIVKRRGRPAARPLNLSIARPGRLSRALVGPSLSLAAARSAASEAVV